MKVLALILSAGVPLVAPSLQQEVFRFKVEVRSVYVDVFVTRGGKPVTGLTVEDFEVLDNGVRQKIDLVNVNTVPLSALLVLDTSGSVHGKKLQHLVAAAHAFVDGLEAKDDAGLLTLTQFLSLRKGLDRDLAGLHRALDGPMGIGPTALNDALFAGLKLLEDVSGRPMLLVFTDGVDNASWLSESDLFAVSRASEAVIYAVGVQSKAGLSMVSRSGVGSAHWSVTGKGTRFLERLTESSGGRVWWADSSANLKEVYLSILREMKMRYLLSYRPQGVSQEGWHRIEVKLKRRKAGEIRARAGYLAGS